MSRLYQRPEWIEYRAEVIELDGGGCRRCGRGEKDGVPLHVHHTQYFPSRLPWEYPHSVCETLCPGHHAEEHGIIRPSSRWTLLYDEDLEELSGECESCGTEIRYVFYIDHPKWDPLAVGTDCCDRLTGSDIALNIRRKIDRRKNFLRSTRWQETPNGILIRQKRMEFAVRGSPNGYYIDLAGHRGKERYPTRDSAKAKVFDIVEDGIAENFLRTHKPKHQ